MRYVYLVRAGRKEYKVGIANNVEQRIKTLQTSNAKRIELVTAKSTPEAANIERDIHRLLKKYKLEGGREWFMLSPPKVIDICVMINSSPGLTLSEVEQLEVMIHDHAALQRDMIAKTENILELAKRQLRPKVVVSKAAVKEIKQPKIDREKRLTDDTEQAMELIRTHGHISTSFMQRHLNIGYGRAARIMDNLERMGVVSELDGIRREVIARHDIKELANKSAMASLF